MKKFILTLLLLGFSTIASALPYRYEALNLNKQQYLQVQQVVNNYEPEIQKTLIMIHNNGVALNQVSRLPTTKENRIAKAQQLSMLSEGSGFINARLQSLLINRDRDISSFLNQQQIEVLNRIPQENIIVSGGNNLIPVR